MERRVVRPSAAAASSTPEDDKAKKPPRSSWVARFALLAVVTMVGGSLVLLGAQSGPLAARSLRADPPPPLPLDAVRPTPPVEAEATLPPTPPRLKIAVAVTVTVDGPYLDGAAVLQHSIRMTNSIHDVSMVAIVHPGVVTTRPALAKLGFEVIEFPPPITSAEIKGKHLRETIDKSGCCGTLELLKLYAWKLEQFDRVLAMDMDTIWMQNLDALFERDLEPGAVMFTYDHAMDAPKQSRAPPVQGGFLLLRPSAKTFEHMIDIVREGDFRQNTGWGGTKIGWCWGGQTVQGLVSYYVNIVVPGSGVVLDPCEYNSMASTKDCEQSAKAHIDAVKSIHYTVCQKPWECRRGANGVCAAFLHAWWMVRDDLEKAQGLPVYGRCCGASPSAICPHKSYKVRRRATCGMLTSAWSRPCSKTGSRRCRCACSPTSWGSRGPSWLCPKTCRTTVTTRLLLAPAYGGRVRPHAQCMCVCVCKRGGSLLL